MTCPAGQRVGLSAVRRPAGLLSLVLLALSLGWSQAISYTVQVVALSDQQSALNVQRALLEQSFPAYVVRATTAQGDIYRVRVGSFANRSAAVLFAQAMPQTAGGPPLPALAEGIPLGVMMLQPRVLAEIELADFEVLPWQEGIALRLQPDLHLPASYRVFRGGEAALFDAWRAEPREQAVLRLRNLLLWPATWEEDEPEVREEYRAARLDGLAARLRLEPERLEALQYRPLYGPPFLVVLELTDALSSTGGTILGVAAVAESVSGHGPTRLALGSAELPERLEPLYRVGGDRSVEQESYQGDGWRASGAGEFFMVTQTEGESPAWKVGVGMPLWGHANYLLVKFRDRYIIYDFVSR